MKLRRICTLGLSVMFGLALTLCAVYAQRDTETAKDSMNEADDKIIAEIHDQAHEQDLVEGAQVMAAWAYNVAQLPDLLPRKPAAVSGATAGN